ncbi:MAG: hypothetical protein ABJH45_16670 [Paracoccaceae bacterium]
MSLVDPYDFYAAALPSETIGAIDRFWSHFSDHTEALDALFKDASTDADTRDPISPEKIAATYLARFREDLLLSDLNASVDLNGRLAVASFIDVALTDVPQGLAAVLRDMHGLDRAEVLFLDVGLTGQAHPFLGATPKSQ